MNGLELSRQYFYDVAEPHLKQDYPDLYKRLAAGLVGNGSECFCCDDEISRDHDWGIDFFLWLPEADRLSAADLHKWKNSLFMKHPPKFMRTRSEYGARIDVMTVTDFYKSLIGYPNGPDELSQWRSVPEENLAMVVNGDVFIDNAGEFSAIRQKMLQYYPEDVRKKKLAAKCMAIAQTGQYNLSRCYKRKDWVTFKIVLSRFTESVIAAVFLLNKTYRPYYKWAFRKMTGLPVLGEQIGRLLNDIAVTCVRDDTAYKTIDDNIGRICTRLIDEMKAQHLAASDDWFLTTQAEEIRSSIQDSFLRSLPAQYE